MLPDFIKYGHTPTEIISMWLFATDDRYNGPASLTKGELEKYMWYANARARKGEHKRNSLKPPCCVVSKQIIPGRYGDWSCLIVSGSVMLLTGIEDTGEFSIFSPKGIDPDEENHTKTTATCRLPAGSYRLAKRGEIHDIVDGLFSQKWLM